MSGLDGSEKICYIFCEVISMAKLSSGMADKLKNMARDLKDEKTTGVKKLGDKVKSSEARKKQSISDEKVSGRKD